MEEKQLSLFGDFFNIPKNKNNLLLLQNRKNIVPLQNKNETDKMLGKAKIAKVYKELPAPVDFIRFGNEFVDEFLSGKEATKLTINALKIVFNIVSQLRNEQFQEKNQPQQLKLFEEEFASEHNSYSEIKIRNSVITRDSELLKKAYEFLESYKKGWYNFTTSEGKNVQAYGGLISNIFYQESGYTSFLISSYWIKRLIQIDSYNKTLYRLVYNVRSNKHILFYFWLSKIPMEGTVVKVSTLNEYFDINYSGAREICRDFLKSIRENLNKYSHKSFNYNYMGELITIKPYLTQYIDSEATVNEATKKEIRSDYKIRYFKDRHQLTEEEIKQIKYILEKEKNPKTLELFSEAYESFVADCRKKDEKATDYIGRKFLIKYQEYIELSYSKTKEAKYIPRCPFQVC